MPDQLLHTNALSGRFVVEGTLGRGGMATVYLARDRELERLVALKVLSDSLAADPAFRARFLREARLAAKLVHPNVVQVYDVGEDERGLVIVMEYVEGETLAAELDRRGQIPGAEAAGIAIQVCSALQAAHTAHLVHRDVKPHNILRRTDGVVKLADFGIARSLAATRHTELGTVLGTAAYLSPEQARGEPVTSAADLYSLGVVLYELLVGRLPFAAQSLSELVLKRELGEITPPGELTPMPPALNDAVLACLAPRPEDRPASAAALAQRIAAAVDERPTAPLSDAATRATEILPLEAGTELVRHEHANRRARMLAAAKRRPLAVLAILVVLALGAVLAAALAGSGSSPPGRAAGTEPARTTSPVTTKPAVPLTRTTSAHTATSHPPAATPGEAIARARAAIFHGESTGQLDPGAGNDLDNRLDDVARSLASGSSQDAAHKTDDLLHHLTDLARAGQLGGAPLGAITRAIERLSALLPAQPAAPPAPANPGPPHPKGPPPGHAGKHKGH